MRKLNRLTLTLALLLTAVGGAWAQDALIVKELVPPAEWETDESNLTPADLPGFYTSTFDKAKAWKGAPTDGAAMLIYAFEGDDAHYVYFDNGTPEDKDYTFTFTKASVFLFTKIYYTAEPADPTEWLLTPDADKKVWTLYKMPASNIELQVEYFAESNLFLSKDALADKANIAVTAGETAVAFGDDGKSTTTVTEGTPMTVTYNGTKKLLGMKVEKKAGAKTLAEATAEDVGKIAGKDGKIYATKADAEVVATGNAVAMIAYVGTASDCTHGLAIALANESGSKSWSDAGDVCSGKTAVTGGTWRLPSNKDWQYMFIGCGSNESYSEPYDSMKKNWSGLASKLQAAGGTVIPDLLHWSSTANSSGEYGWSLGFGNNGDAVFYDVYEGDDTYVRACLAF